MERPDVWIGESARIGAPADGRFEAAFVRDSSSITPWVDSPLPAGVFWAFRGTYQALDRLRAGGWRPDFVVDVGCSTGVWSHVCHHVFPDARYLLIDPLLEEYRALNDWHFRRHPQFEAAAVALGAAPGRIAFHVSRDLYGSSFYSPEGNRAGRVTEVDVRTLAQMTTGFEGQGLLKIDAQSSEKPILDGAGESLAKMDAVILELSLRDQPEGVSAFSSMVERMANLGFEYWDDAGTWRSPHNGCLLEKDVLFFRKERFPGISAPVPPAGRWS
jgi:FkbM family methyltransferase